MAVMVAGASRLFVIVINNRATTTLQAGRQGASCQLHYVHTTEKRSRDQTSIVQRLAWRTADRVSMHSPIPPYAL